MTTINVNYVIGDNGRPLAAGVVCRCGDDVVVCPRHGKQPLCVDGRPCCTRKGCHCVNCKRFKETK
jgi:hypothetical protein